FFRWNVAVMQSGNHGAVWVWKLSFAVSFDCGIVAQNRTKAIEVTFLVSHGNDFPIAVAGRNLRDENRGSLLIGMSKRWGREGGNSNHTCKSYQQENHPFHKFLISMCIRLIFHKGQSKQFPTPCRITAISNNTAKDASRDAGFFS